MQFSTRNRRHRSKVTSEISSKKQVGFQPNGRQRIPAYVVEIEYRATEDAADRPPRASESLPRIPEAQGSPTEAERREKVVKFLAEAVYGYLKRNGLLALQGAHVGENDTPEGKRAGGEDSP
jgi:hypothetical protein